MICKTCPKSKNLPTIPCSDFHCEWNIPSYIFCNCFLMVLDTIDIFSVESFSEEEIAEILGMTVEEVNSVLENAIKKIRVSMRKKLIEIE